MTDTIDNEVAKTPTILIADDDPSVLQLLAGRCAKLGFDVRTASNGMQALIMAKQRPPDVLLVDVNMPEVDGLSLLVRLLASGKKTVDAIVITGSSDPETIERCSAFGAVYGHKGPELWNVVRTALAEIFPAMVTGTDESQASTMRERPRVLVVDDDPDVGIFLASRLEKAGVVPLLAPDGVKGYRIACREKPSVIVSDYFMPNGDANYLLWRLRSTGTTEKIPVFVISARALDPSTEADLRREGAVRFFRKPFDTNELFLALQEYCAIEYNPA